MLQIYGKEKIKKLRTSFDHAVFFVCPKNQDIPKDIVNLLEFQLYFIQSNGIYADTVINKVDAISKAIALNCKKFAMLHINYLVDWNHQLVRNLKEHEFDTIIGNNHFYYTTLEYAGANDFVDYEYERELIYTRLEYNDVIKNIKKDKKYFNKNYFSYNSVIDKIKSLHIKNIILPWAEERTLKILDNLKSYDCKIILYHDDELKLKHSLVQQVLKWDLFSEQSKAHMFHYLINLNELTYFDTGSIFVDFDKSIFYNTQQRCELIQKLQNQIISQTGLVVMGGVFPWQHQAIFKYPKHHNWMYYPWNLEKF